MPTWNVTTPPTTAILSWDQIKHHVRPASVSEQSYIMGDLLPSCYAYAETMMECALSPQTITASYDIQDVGWNVGELNSLDQWQGRFRWELPKGPVLSITSVLDSGGNAIEYRRHTAGTTDYIVPLQPIIWTQCPITTVYQAGYESIPADVLNAIKVHIASIYFTRENTSNLPANAVHKLDDFYRWKGRGSCVA